MFGVIEAGGSRDDMGGKRVCDESRNTGGRERGNMRGREVRGGWVGEGGMRTTVTEMR